MVGEVNQAKSWLSRPEGKVGTVLGVAMLAAGGIAVLYFWGLILPWLILMASNTLTLIGLCAAIAVACVVVFDPRWRNLLFYGYKSLMRALTGMFIELDPIGILKTYVQTLGAKLEEMNASIANLDGQRNKIRIAIRKNEEAIKHCLELASQAMHQNPPQQAAATLNSRQAERLKNSNANLQDLLNRMDMLARVLGKMRDASAIMVEDIKNEVDLKTKERAMLLAGYNAFSKAKSIMRGGGDEAEMFNMTMERLADDYGMKMGEIESFMNDSQGFLQSVDLENGLADKHAMEQIAAWEQRSATILDGTKINANAQVRVDAPTAANSAGAGEFDALFNDAGAAKTMSANPSNRNN